MIDLGIIGAAAAAPAVPAAAALGIWFVLIAASLLMWGLYYGYDATLGALLRELAETLDGIWFIGGKIASALAGVDDRIGESIQAAASELDKTASKFWGALEWLVKVMADALVDFASDVHTAISNLTDATVPGKIADLRRELRHSIDGLSETSAAAARAEAIRRTRGIDALTRDLTAERIRSSQGIDALEAKVTAKVAESYGILSRELGDVWGYARRTLSRRLSRVEALVLSGAITAIAVRALDRRFPFWKCTNVRQANRALCRMPVGLLSALLATTVAALVLSDVCLIANAVRRGAELAEPAIRKLAVVVGAATHCTSMKKAPALTLAAVALPIPLGPIPL